MRRTRLGVRAITGLLLAGLLAAALSPGTAGAAAKAVRGPDLALGRSVTATGSHPDHPAARLTDGNQLTYWEGPLGSFPQSVRIDLGGTVRVDEVVLKLPAAWEARTQTLTVEGGTDGSSFTALSASAAHRFDPDRANTVTLTFPARGVRHLRIPLTANTGWNAAQLSAVEVYGEDGGEGPGQSPADGTDLALGRPVEASSTIHSFVAAHANDGRIDTYWESAGHPATLTVRLGAEADVTAVVVKLNPDAAWERRTQSIEVLGRDRSSGAYTTLKARTDHTFDPAGNGNTVTVPVTGRVADVQLKFSHNSAGYGAQVAELEVRGTAAPNPDLTVTTLDWTPAAPTETDPVTVRATVRNTGTAQSAAATLSVSLEGAVVGSAPVGALAPGASATVSVHAGGTIRGGDGGAEGGVGLNGRFGKNTRISNVWIEHANVGVWVGRDHSDIPDLWNPADGLEFTGMRIRNTYADGINLTNGSHDSTVQNSSFRNTGDDALAVWSSKHVKNPAADTGHDNHFRNNTVQLPWRANGIAIYGGHGNTVENNLVYDTMNYPGIMPATDHDPTPFSGQTLIAGNGLYRAGGAFWNEDQEFGAITLFAQGLDIPGVVIHDTDIHDSTYDGIQFKAGGGAMPDVRISDVTISKSNNGPGILAMGGARGSATLTNVTITGSAEGDVLIEPGSSFVINR
ncbi:galactose-binding domain-containing protein [Streptomyces albogriseolus]|uniref:galactose-binding domain-containing protein n=1 Tax=Streptomyces albogriseolus TaxID=1887 RepID=UPI003D70494F